MTKSLVVQIWSDGHVLPWFYFAPNDPKWPFRMDLGWKSGQTLPMLLDGGAADTAGICKLPGITELNLSGIDFAEITDLAPLYVIDDLTDLWLVDSQNMDAAGLYELLDNLETIEGTDVEGVLYMTQAN
jgi:hypothetical protein